MSSAIGSVIRSTSLLFPRTYNAPSAGGISLYCTMSESHKYESMVSKYPVQSGSTIIDNVIQTPTIINMRVLVSDSPITLVDITPNISNIVSFSRGVDEVQRAVGWNNIETYSITAMEALIKLQENRQPITLVTGIKVYNDMLLTKMDVPREPSTGRALFFDLEFTEVMKSTVSISEISIDPKSMITETIVQKFTQSSSFGGVALNALNRAVTGQVANVTTYLKNAIGLPSIIGDYFF